MSEYVVIYEQAEDGGWSAYLPDLPVFALGTSKEQASDRLREALDAYVDELRRSGESLPDPVHLAETAQVEG